MIIEKRKGLVRGVATITQGHGNFEEFKVYTFWYRHDEPNLEIKLNDALSRLMRVYLADCWRCEGVMMSVEWKDYNK